MVKLIFGTGITNFARQVVAWKIRYVTALDSKVDLCIVPVKRALYDRSTAPFLLTLGLEPDQR